MECDQCKNTEFVCNDCGEMTTHANESPGADLLSGDQRNVLPEKVVDMFAEYWCEPDRCQRDENLGGFIQRVAQYAVDHCTDAPGCTRYSLTCKECGDKTKLQARDFFAAGEKFVTMGWRHDRLYKGYLCKKCNI